jgi:hypothetical protein
MAPQSVRLACDRASQATSTKVSHKMGDQNFYLDLLRASEDTLSCWTRLHLQSLAPTPISRRVEVRQAAGRKNNC